MSQGAFPHPLLAGSAAKLKDPPRPSWSHLAPAASLKPTPRALGACEQEASGEASGRALRTASNGV